MFKHILVPLDGSPTSSLALRKAAGLSKAFGSRVTVITVLDSYSFTHSGPEIAMGYDFAGAARSNAATIVDKGAAELSELGIVAEKKVVEAHVLHEAILETAASVDADLIAMGSHGRHGVEKLILGSTAQRVLSHARLPVLVLRGE